MNYELNVQQSKEPNLFIINQKQDKKITKIYYIIGEF
jgi:hypothetical protein